MTVKAKFFVASVTDHAGGGSQIVMRPISPYPMPENHPNRRFWEATPSGELTMNLTAKAASARAYFEAGTEYILTFEKDNDSL